MEDYWKGKALLDEKEYDKARMVFQAGLDSGDIRCSYGLLAVDASQGVDRTRSLSLLESSLERLEQMAGAGDGDACFILGRCYETGSAVAFDISAAMKFYTKAAARGNLDAMFNLGCIYIQMGPGGKTIAADYFREAADKGHRQAAMAYAHMKKDEKSTC